MVRKLRIELKMIKSGSPTPPYTRPDCFDLLAHATMFPVATGKNNTYAAVLLNAKTRLKAGFDVTHGLRLWVFSPFNDEHDPAELQTSGDGFTDMLEIWIADNDEETPTCSSKMLIYCEEGSTDSWALQPPVSASSQSSLAAGAALAACPPADCTSSCTRAVLSASAAREAATRAARLGSLVHMCSTSSTLQRAPSGLVFAASGATPPARWRPAQFWRGLWGVVDGHGVGGRAPVLLRRARNARRGCAQAFLRRRSPTSFPAHNAARGQRGRPCGRASRAV